MKKMSKLPQYGILILTACVLLKICSTQVIDIRFNTFKIRQNVIIKIILKTGKTAKIKAICLYLTNFIYIFC